MVAADIAHNVFFTRGASFSEEPISVTEEISGTSSKRSYDALRIFVWARSKHVGSRDPSAVSMAVCELGGQIMVFDQESFNNIGEEEVARAQRDVASAVFSEVKEKVAKIMKADD